MKNRSRLSTRAAVGGAVVSLALIATAALELNGDPAASIPAGPYVALGDSYTAGPGIPGQTATPTGCQRSDQNYPSLVARELNLAPADFRDASCSGATIDDLTAGQDTGNGTNAAQLSALSADTHIVTLGIGGNDIGFADLLKGCVKAALVNYAIGLGRTAPDAAPCRQEHIASGSDDVEEKIAVVGPRLGVALADIRARAPHARVYVVGYPAILPAGGADCTFPLGLAPGDVTWLREKEQHLDAMLRHQAGQTGASYVDTWAPSLGHDACTSADTRWIEPLLPQDTTAPVHPNARGEAGMADAVASALRG